MEANEIHCRVDTKAFNIMLLYTLKATQCNSANLKLHLNSRAVIPVTSQ